MDIASISTALQSTKSALDAVKYFKNLNETIKNVEFNSKIIELSETILTIKEKLLEAKEDNLALQEKVSLLENQLKDTSEMKFDGKVYYQINGDKKEGPFCSPCLDNCKTKIRLHLDVNEWYCYVCKNHFKSKN